MIPQFDRAVLAYESKQYNEAYSLFNEIADENPNAMVNLAMMHMKGAGCKQDNEVAFTLFEKAAQSDNNYALNSLGIFYEKGMIGNANADKAIEYYKRAADVGNVNAQLKAGMLYRQKGNIAEAMRYLVTAAHNNNEQAQELITFASNAELATSRNNEFRILTPEQQRLLVENLIETKIRPTLASDNGGIELINYIAGEKPQIWLNYLGACSGCHLGSTSTADMLLNHFETMIDKNVVLYLM